MGHELHPELYGWWRILETSQWVNQKLSSIVMQLRQPKA
jgi:hypothetical protein